MKNLASFRHLPTLLISPLMELFKPVDYQGMNQSRSLNYS